MNNEPYDEDCDVPNPPHWASDGLPDDVLPSRFWRETAKTSKPHIRHFYKPEESKTSASPASPVAAESNKPVLKTTSDSPELELLPRMGGANDRDYLLDARQALLRLMKQRQSFRTVNSPSTPIEVDYEEDSVDRRTQKQPSSSEKPLALHRVLLPWALSSALLLLAVLSRFPYPFYLILRSVCCLTFAYTTFGVFDVDETPWAWLYAFLAFLYNPIFPVHLKRDSWVDMNWLTLLVLIVTTGVFRKKLFLDEQLGSDSRRNFLLPALLGFIVLIAFASLSTKS